MRWELALLSPAQLGYGTCRGSEAAVHAARSHLANMDEDTRIMLKMDFRNAFNSIGRDKMFHAVQ